MRILAKNQTLVIVEVDDLKQLSLVAHPDTDLARALITVGAGTLTDADHAMISIEFLREAARAEHDLERWLTEFDAMIAYAATKGWVDAQGVFVRVHVQSWGDAPVSSPR